MKNLFNQELTFRILSLIVFVPLMLVPIVISNYLLAFVYMLFNSIIINEILLMKTNSKNKKIYNFALIIITYIFFIFITLNITESISTKIVIKVIIIIWLFDTFSYVGGKVIGGKKLMPIISSGKTVSGLATGVILTLISVLIYQITNNEFEIILILFTFSIIIFSFLGDLIASILKRISYFKDSGSIMPGHGGLLDRLDSFLGVFLFLGTLKIFT